MMFALSLVLVANSLDEVKGAKISGFYVVDGVRLHYLDWGGAGDVVLIITGTGDTAYAYEKFAPRFTDQFRVIALTRRGYGKSDKPESGYDIPTLSHDVLGFMDHSNIKRAHVICHSAGGDETTYLAVHFPERVGRLVYMEAAYNREKVPELERLDPMGAGKPSSREQELHWKGMDVFRPDFKSIKAPVLSFYSIFDRHPAMNDDTSPELKEKAEKFFKEYIRPYQMDNIAQFRKDVPQAQIVEILNSDHYFFEDAKQAETVRETIRTFLKGKD